MKASDEVITAVGRSIMAGAQAGTMFESEATMSAMAMAVSTLLHHAALEANINRAGLMDTFFDSVVVCLKRIDQNDANRR